MKYLDQLQRTVNLEKVPKRIVSLVPSQTELLVDLGLESSIVGLTKFCVHPIGLRKEKTIVGGTKTVSFDKIKALRPDVILCNKEENTKAMISELEHIAPVHISDIYNLTDALELIGLYGALFSVRQNAISLIQEIKESRDGFLEYVQDKPKLKVAYFIWKDPWMVAGKRTFIDAMIRLNGFENYFGNLERYPEVDMTTIDGHLDVVFLSSEPFPFNDKHSGNLAQKFKSTKVVIVDGEYFSWYGSRLRGAFTYFKSLHQSL